MLPASARLALFVVIHAGLAALGLALDSWLAWAVIWAIQAVNLLTIAAVVHESVHQHYFPSRRASRIAGTVAGCFALTCFEGYRAIHVMHHAHTCDEGDSEGEPYRFTARWQIIAAFLGGGIYFTSTVLTSSVYVALGGTPSWLTAESQRRRIRINVALFALMAALVVAGIAADVVSFRTLAFVWFVPVWVSLFGPLPFVLMPEHYDAPGPGPVGTNTRTCVSNPVIRFVYMNGNLHTAHHDRASVPWHALERHHAKIVADIEPEWIFPTYSSFYRFMWATTGQGRAADPVQAAEVLPERQPQTT